MYNGMPRCLHCSKLCRSFVSTRLKKKIFVSNEIYWTAFGEVLFCKLNSLIPLNVKSKGARFLSNRSPNDVSSRTLFLPRVSDLLAPDCRFIQGFVVVSSYQQGTPYMILGNHEVSSSSSSDSAGGTGNWFLCSTAHEFRRALILNSLHFWPKPERESSIIKINRPVRLNMWQPGFPMIIVAENGYYRNKTSTIAKSAFEITIVEINFSSMWSLWSLRLQKKEFTDGNVYNKTTSSDRYHSYRC